MIYGRSYLNLIHHDSYRIRRLLRTRNIGNTCNFTMLFDTDILSMLAKVGKVELVRLLFPEEDLLITFEVYNELLKAKEAGYDFIDDILKIGIKIVHLSPDLTKEYEQKQAYLKNLHTGELTSILLCKRECMTFVTNDR